MKKHIFYISCLALILFTRLLFLVYEHAEFSSDNALFGIMANDIAGLENFPVFTYGEKYALPLSSYLAAPLFAIFGSSVFMLKLPMLILNIVVLVQIANIFTKEQGLSYLEALVPCSFFAACGFVLSGRFTNLENGIEAFVMILLAWKHRNKPLLFGIISAVGFHVRAFTVFATAWTLLFSLIENKSRFRHLLLFSTSFIFVFFSIFLAGSLLPNYSGSETGTFLDITNIRDIPSVLSYLLRDLLPAMLCARFVSLQEMGIPGVTAVNARLGWVVISAGMIAVLVTGIAAAARSLRARDISSRDYFPIFLILTGLSSCAAYVLFRGGGTLDLMHIRYIYFALLIPMGLSALAIIKFRGSPAARNILAAAALAVALANVSGSMQLWREYIFHTPENEFRMLTNYLTENGVNYASADYWTAYHITFLSGEQVLVNPNSNIRVQDISLEYIENAYDAYSITQIPCPGGERVARWYVCPRTDFTGKETPQP